jgi:hypothetical protein
MTFYRIFSLKYFLSRSGDSRTEILLLIIEAKRKTKNNIDIDVLLSPLISIDSLYPLTDVLFVEVEISSSK